MASNCTQNENYNALLSDVFNWCTWLWKLILNNAMIYCVVCEADSEKSYRINELASSHAKEDEEVNKKRARARRRARERNKSGYFSLRKYFVMDEKCVRSQQFWNFWSRRQRNISNMLHSETVSVQSTHLYSFINLSCCSGHNMAFWMSYACGKCVVLKMREGSEWNLHVKSFPEKGESV